ncbi:MAG: prephenate dehydrogenase/arogenate dehydrogenase family protein [Nitrososphaerales archaeon]
MSDRKKKKYQSKKPRDIKHLKIYREEMRDITRSILDLARARQNISRRIAEVKESAGQDIENHAVEEKLSSDMIHYARSLDIDEDLAKSVVEVLIDYSKVAQRKEIYLKSIKAHLRSNNIKTVSIIGAGRMGSWFANYFLETGTRVVLFDKVRHDSTNARELVMGRICKYAKTFEDVTRSDLVIVSVPIKSTPGEIRKLVKYARENQQRTMKIIEISSVKNEMVRANLFKKSTIPSNLEIYSIHPLFGPNANPYSVNSMISIKPTGQSFVNGLFPQYRMFRMDSQSHDKLMGTMLTLPHAHALAFADSIVKRSEEIPEQISSPSFDYILDLAKRVLRESERVYYEILSTNPYSVKAIDETLGSMAKLRKLLRKGPEFQKFFREAKRALN